MIMQKKKKENGTSHTAYQVLRTARMNMAREGFVEGLLLGSLKTSVIPVNSHRRWDFRSFDDR